MINLPTIQCATLFIRTVKHNLATKFGMVHLPCFATLLCTNKQVGFFIQRQNLLHENNTDFRLMKELLLYIKKTGREKSYILEKKGNSLKNQA